MGEAHGKPQNIAIATQYLEKTIESNPNIALALEHIDSSKQPLLKNWTQSYENADKLAIALEWWKSGWPNWMVYRPLFIKAYEHNIPLIATDNSTSLPLAQIQTLWAADFDEAYGAWALIIKDYHNNDIEEEKLHRLILLQMSRDIHMAKTIDVFLKENPDKTVFYLAGQDHVRNHYSVKSLLKHYSSFSIATNCPKLNHQFNKVIALCYQGDNK